MIMHWQIIVDGETKVTVALFYVDNRPLTWPESWDVDFGKGIPFINNQYDAV